MQTTFCIVTTLLATPVSDQEQPCLCCVCSYKATFFLTCKYFRKYAICVYLKVYNFVQEEGKQPCIQCTNLLTPFAAKRSRKRLVGSISTDVSLQGIIYMNIVPFNLT